MPPKRSRSGPTGPSKKQTTVVSKKKKQQQRTQDIREDSPEKDFDSYADAVRDEILNATKSRYDVSLEQDHLAFAAALMESSSSSRVDGWAETTVTPRVMLSDGIVGQDRTGTGSKTRVYSLGTFCLHAVVKSFERLAVDVTTTNQVRPPPTTKGATAATATGGARFRRQVQQLPYYLSERLFKVLKHSRPELLSTKIWTSLFFSLEMGAGDRTEELDLEGLIPSQVTDTVIRTHLLRHLGVGQGLTRVNLSHQTGLSDKCVAELVRASPRIQRLSLKGCTKVGDLTLASLAEESLEELNVSFAAGCTGKGIKDMVFRCRGLKVLKVAGLANIKDAVFLNLEKELAVEEDKENPGRAEGSRPLSKLENLKISTTGLGDRGLKVVLGLCGRSIRRLDISQTGVSRPSIIGQHCVWKNAGQGKGGREGDQTTASARMMTRLEKLNLTRLTMSTASELSNLIRQLPPNSLHTLLMSYLTHSRAVFGGGVFDEMSSSSEDGPVPAGSGQVIAAVQGAIPVPSAGPTGPKFRLQTLSLFGNSELGSTARDRGALRTLLGTLAPYLKRLELGYTGYNHEVLIDLSESRARRPDHEEESEGEGGQNLGINDVLEELGLDATRIGAKGAVVLSRFRGLRRLSLANTQISKDAVEIIVEACPALNSLDLTSCRGVPVVQRRTLLKDIRHKSSSSLP
ncbi:hypothetical protein BGX33_006782 [Mortierella sp. NVP41]|nr:hypothetical protein BGX33_006782 [Mortierella sp. NVP41]